MSHPNDRSLAEKAKALLSEDQGDHEDDAGFGTMQADVYARLEVARQLGRIADALERLPHNLDRH